MKCKKLRLVRWMGAVLVGLVVMCCNLWAVESSVDDEITEDGVSICISAPNDIRMQESGVAKVLIRNNRPESIEAYGTRQAIVDLPMLCKSPGEPFDVTSNWVTIRPGQTWIGGSTLSPYTTSGFEGAIGSHEIRFEISLDFDGDLRIDNSVSLRTEFAISECSQVVGDLIETEGYSQDLCWDDGRKATGRTVDLRKVQIARKHEIANELGLTLHTDSAGSNGLESEKELQRALDNDDAYRGVEKILRNRYGMDNLFRPKYLEKAKRFVADPNTYGQLEPTIVWGVDLTKRAKSGDVPAKALLCLYDAAERGRLAGLNCLDVLEEEAAKCSERFFISGIRDAMLVSEALQDGSEQNLTSVRN